MLNPMLSLLLSLQLLCSGTTLSPVQPSTSYQPLALARTTQNSPEVQRVVWGLIDPELATWFSHIPSEETEWEERILWDWSWRGFLAALFECPVVKEAQFDAAQA